MAEERHRSYEDLKLVKYRNRLSLDHKRNFQTYANYVRKLRETVGRLVLNG